MGSEMWRLDSGVTTRGITPGNVTTVTVAPNAITQRVAVTTFDSLVISTFGTDLISLTIGPIDQGDTIMLLFKGTVVLTGATGGPVINFTLRETIVSGLTIDYADISADGVAHVTVVLQALWTSPGSLTHNIFVLRGITNNINVTINRLSLIGVHFRR